MVNVIVEIDGVRHRKVKTKCSGDLCQKCSLKPYCHDIIDTPGTGMNTRFVLAR